MSFSFRQRVGRIEWSEIDATDLEACVNERDTKALQNLLDMVTFSEVWQIFHEYRLAKINSGSLLVLKITPRDISGCGKTVVCKCIRILQFIVEYLLYTQDSCLRSVGEKTQFIDKLNQ